MAAPVPHNIEGSASPIFFCPFPPTFPPFPLLASALSMAACKVAMSFSFSQGFTMKSNAPRFMPSTAKAMSAYAVNSTTSVCGRRCLISESQNRPSFPVLVSASKFISSKMTSGANSRNEAWISLGEASNSTAAKYLGNKIFNAARMPGLSSTTNIFPLFTMICFSFLLLFSIQK